MKKLLFTFLFLVSFAQMVSCKKKEISGCTDPSAINFQPEANVSDNKTCQYPDELIEEKQMAEAIQGNWNVVSYFYLDFTGIKQYMGDTIQSQSYTLMKNKEVGGEAIISTVYTDGSSDQVITEYEIYKDGKTVCFDQECWNLNLSKDTLILTDYTGYISYYRKILIR